MRTSNVAYYLVTHGSRDPRSWSVLQEIANLAQKQEPSIFIGWGCLEGLPLSLAQQLQKFGQEAQARECNRIIIEPLFLIPGVHVNQDIPKEVAIAQQHFATLQFQIAPYLGESPQIPQLIQTHFERNIPLAQKHKTARILIAHGSRREGANLPIEKLAQQAGAIAAYWSVPPSLETQIEVSIAQGAEKIAVMPYFLAPGGITEAIAAKILDSPYQAQIHFMSVPLSLVQIADLAISDGLSLG
ncbi:sirohydrochlorin chelatase [Tumidithrix elongata RA019]|uniref:Sirohydrochlorin chelatase n=1 Tax=Tumidithrix elongata BACA0141 TaxID=2716417 RepID=A0AAW9PY51_9CYAN|nr:sirohydrochlorin chelatase [Tumidithrix elongata RA019]